MKKATILSFTEDGQLLASKIATELTDYTSERFTPRGNLAAIMQSRFSVSDALIFIGACGIAVRAIAPHLVSKTTDPAVVVLDDHGQFVISLLSGHIGGANELARQIASLTGGVPVITTATDTHHRFAADVFAQNNDLFIEDMACAKRFAAEILLRDLPINSDFPIENPLPSGLYMGSTGSCGLMISCRKAYPFDTTLLLVPKRLHVGIGCKHGISSARIEALYSRALAPFHPMAIRSIASIDVKREEPGLLQFARQCQVPLSFFSAEELQQVPGTFSHSDFVQKTVGVDNVCERAAMCAAGPGAMLILPKTSLDGVTIAVAQEKWSVSFE